MIGLIYPGVNRLDYDFAAEGGIFPGAHRIEQRSGGGALAGEGHPHASGRASGRRATIRWASRISTRTGFAGWARRGKDCFDADRARGTCAALGASMNECMRCWEAMLPDTVRHRTIPVDLTGLLQALSVAAIPGRCIPAAAADICTWSRRSRCRAQFTVKVRVRK